MALTIEQIKQQYPSYQDVPDEELASAIHKKFYSDVPFEEFASKIGMASPSVNITVPPIEVSPEETTEMPSYAERALGPGSPTYSLVKGAVIDPFIAANQLLANTGLFGERVKEGANQAAKYSQYIQEEGRAKLGRDGFDVIEMVGNIVSPANRLIPNTKAASAFQTIANQAVAGGALSSLIPVVGEDFWSDKNTQVGFGALLSGALPALSLSSAKLSNFVSGLPLTKSARESAIYKYFNNLLGEDKQEAINALREVGEIVSGSKPTSAEALADTTFGAPLIREQSRLATGTETSKRFTQRFKEQADARADELANAFGSASDLIAAKEARLTSTMPMRERALSEANVYGETASKMEEALAKGQKQFGALSTKNRGDILKGQIENIKANGYYPLTVNSLVDRIDSVISSPGTKSNEMLTTAVSSLRGKLVNLADERGIINSADLYNVRKEINLDIAKYMQDRGGANTSFQAQATSVESNLKKLIDNEINKASGSNLWSNYLTKFAQHSRKIDQLEIGTELQNKLGVSLGDVEKAGAFASTVNNAGSLIKRQTGLPRYSKLEDVLTKEQLTSVNKVYADLNRKAKTEQLGKTAERAIGPEKATEARIPGILERGVFIAREVLNTLQRGSSSEFDRRVSELMLDPNKMANFLEEIPKGQVQNITEAMLAKMSPEMRESFIAAYKVIPSNLATQQQIERGLGVTITKEGT
jgi:hypothetical protein